MTDPAVNESRVQKIEHEMDSLVGYILLSGVLLSIGLIAVGIVWNLAATGSLSLKYSISGMNLFQFAVSEIRNVGELKIQSHLFVNLGIVTLMLTPYVRVVASMFFFAFAERNWKYTCFTALVFCVLTYSLFLR